jgi:surface antigen
MNEQIRKSKGLGFGQDFNTVGGDTEKALPEVVSKAEVGDKGGQCGRFVNKATGLGLGDSYQSKMAKMDPNIKKPEAGMVFVMPYKDTGHTGFVLGVNKEKGTVTVKDSNYSLDQKVKIHEIPLSKISGYRRV